MEKYIVELQHKIDIEQKKIRGLQNTYRKNVDLDFRLKPVICNYGHFKASGRKRLLKPSPILNKIFILFNYLCSKNRHPCADAKK